MRVEMMSESGVGRHHARAQARRRGPRLGQMATVALDASALSSNRTIHSSVYSCRIGLPYRTRLRNDRNITLEGDDPLY